MLSRRLTAASALFAFTLASSAAAYAGKDKEQSARDDDEKPRKVAPEKGLPEKKGAPDKGEGKGKDLAARVEALEREVRELTMAIKASRGDAKPKPDADGKPQFDGKKFPEPRKPGAEQAGFKKPEFAKPDFKKPEFAKSDFKKPEFQKPDFQKANLKGSEGKPGEGKKVPPPFDGGHVEFMKGKDGQLYVPLSALPPGLRWKFEEMAAGGHGEKAQQVKGQPEKKPAKKGEENDHPKKKESKE